MARRPRGEKAGKTDRERVTAQIIYDSATRMFSYAIEFESDDDPDESGPFVTANAATDACLTNIDEYCSSIGGLDAADVTLTGGDWDHSENYHRVKFEAGPRYHNWFSGHVYEMNQEELAKEGREAIEKLTEAADAITARHSVPLGQMIDAATVLHKKLHPKRPGSNAPNLKQFLADMFKGIEERTRQRHHKAYLIVASADWPAMDKTYTGTKRGMERIFDAAKQYVGKPTKKRETVSRKQYDRLMSRYDRLRDLATHASIDDVRGAFAEFDHEDDNDAAPEEPT